MGRSAAPAGRDDVGFVWFLVMQCRAACAYMAEVSLGLPCLTSAFTGAEKVSVQHAQLKPGDPCPECREGRVYRQKESKMLIRIVGQAPLKATVFEMERLRCNGCCQMFTAAEPPDVGIDKYDTTAVAMIALLKYGTGVPFNRMERLETQLGIPLPAATQWALMEAAAKQLKRILGEFIRQAAQGSVVHNDDTGMRN
jgi:transposase